MITFFIQFVVSLSFASFSSLVFASTPETSCEMKFDFSNLLAPSEDAVNLDDIRRERHPFVSLLQQDPSQNLAVKYPSIVMNAFQRALALILKHEPKRVMRAGFGSELVNLYPLFHKPLAENEGRFIVGQYAAVEAFVESIIAGANDDGSAVKTLTFEGGAGTGKTLFLDILVLASKYLTERDPDSFMYTFEFIKLSEIPELYDLLRVVPDPETGNRDLELPFPSMIYESPFALLPAGYQDAVLKAATPRAIDLTGVTPTPFHEPNPQNAFIRDAIIDHYAKKAGRKTLSPEEQIAALNKHVVIKRYVVGDRGKTGKIEYQGKDIDWGGLVFAENPMIKGTYGPDHPFAYYYNGKIMQPLFVLFDEFWRNEATLRDYMLTVQESRIVTIGGAPAVKLDAIVAAASNTVSIDKVKVDGTAKAQLDRSRLEPMLASIDPAEIAKTSLAMKGLHKLMQKKLAAPGAASSESPMEPADLDDLYPYKLRRGDPYLMPEGRYALFYNVGPRKEPVAIAPWTIPLIAYVTAATRMETSQEKAVKEGEHFAKTINTVIFRDEVQRIKALIGQIHINAAQDEELRQLSRYLKEGTNGITMRDAANIWLTETLNWAKRPGNESTATPYLAREVLKDLLQKGDLKPESVQQRINWLALMDRIINELILPSIEADIDGALSQGSEDMSAVYDEFVQELLAIGADRTATTFENAARQVSDIDFGRMNAVREIYRRLERQELAAAEIINVQAAYGIMNQERRYHPGLMRALQQYHAELVLKQVSLEAILKFAKSGDGTSVTRQHHDRLVHYMRDRLGYTQRALIDALELVKQKKSRTKQAAN